MTASTASAKTTQTSTTITTTGLKPGQVKHVWLIILENKSYDATFTGLNQNSYLWKTLPAQGVLLKNYYGTGHFSQDNYISLVSGQATQQDTQSDCSVADTDFGTNASIVTSGAEQGPGRVARQRRTAAPTPPTARTAAPTRTTRRRCSTSSTRPEDLEGLRARTSATSPAVRTRSAAVPAPPPTTRPPTRPS